MGSSQSKSALVLGKEAWPGRRELREEDIGGDVGSMA
jgi:hypothetical protein